MGETIDFQPKNIIIQSQRYSDDDFTFYENKLGWLQDYRQLLL